MSEVENVERIREWLDAWNSSDFNFVLAHMDPNIEVEIAMDAPTDGVYHGHDGLIKAMTEFWSQFATHRSELTECIPAGDDVVMAVTQHGTGMGSGIEVEMSHWQVATLSAGKLVRWRNFRTREQAFEAAGLSE